ncbi:SPIN family peroxidase inhibitor [Staphylococcus sp. 30400_3112M30941]|uniref:SPIN family peroxidase inhibitor n=1 Tax=Staphylococcus aureus TaxID=1280 RepID=UPI000F42CD93|nr:SPIN family peroxidase inhibitor [Staphylococcus aureus]MBO0928947.1 SPIN family peroxidase inhibitor [Staphylococcus sp. 30403_3112M30944]MBO0945274.1 SPIN family peroxidase inhibitor [Staphylococcus sp. 30402_3112M30943]MBO0964848.1 SPIN family peroxidase inhibitor [Staphylococcus sp. 30400_3112M30941]MBO0965594.1 SPIN family peroxidase inhibitor [Staphylococcus sp. 30401_3112M30942]RNH88284.1 SPIN family peroxidase inhibitor [Staphylococcus aureus]
MKLKKVIMATVAVGILSTGVLFETNNSYAKVTSQNGLTLHDDSRLLEHELSYVDVLIDKKTDKETKQQLKDYFAEQGLYSVKDIVKKAKKDGLDISKYTKYLK